jgi:hypothetical protein
MNYTYDPRMLSVRRIWSGGFLNMKEERTSRGRDLPKMGKGAKVHYEGIALLQPLTSKGEAVDFEFKEPDAQDNAAIEKHLWDKVGFDERLAALDAEFLGHHAATGTSNPSFRFRVGKNVFDQTITLNEKGALAITLSGATKEAQTFTVAASQLSNLKVVGGKLERTSGRFQQAKKARSRSKHNSMSSQRSAKQSQSRRIGRRKNSLQNLQCQAKLLSSFQQVIVWKIGFLR